MVLFSYVLVSSVRALYRQSWPVARLARCNGRRQRRSLGLGLGQVGGQDSPACHALLERPLKEPRPRPAMLVPVRVGRDIHVPARILQPDPESALIRERGVRGIGQERVQDVPRVRVSLVDLTGRPVEAPTGPTLGPSPGRNIGLEVVVRTAWPAGSSTPGVHGRSTGPCPSGCHEPEASSAPREPDREPAGRPAWNARSPSHWPTRWQRPAGRPRLRRRRRNHRPILLRFAGVWEGRGNTPRPVRVSSRSCPRRDW